jgi:hypothetical protein
MHTLTHADSRDYYYLQEQDAFLCLRQLVLELLLVLCEQTHLALQRRVLELVVPTLVLESARINLL